MINVLVYVELVRLYITRKISLSIFNYQKESYLKHSKLYIKKTYENNKEKELVAVFFLEQNQPWVLFNYIFIYSLYKINIYNIIDI